MTIGKLPTDGLALSPFTLIKLKSKMIELDQLFINEEHQYGN